MCKDKQVDCIVCGSVINAESLFCEFCGARQKPGAGSQDADKTSFTLPPVDVKPNLGKALSSGWDILMNDIVGTLTVSFIYFIITIVAGCIPLFGVFVTTALQIGMFGWAERRRQGKVAGVETVFKVAIDRFNESLLLALLLMVVGLIMVLPMLLVYIPLMTSILPSILGTPYSSGSPPVPPPSQMFLMPVASIFISLYAGIIGFIIGPFLSALEYMIFWAIANGKTFGESLPWAWSRIKKNPFHWWLSGLVLNLISGLGVYVCYVGLIVTLPWGILAWTIFISEKDESGVNKTDL